MAETPAPKTDAPSRNVTVKLSGAGFTLQYGGPEPLGSGSFGYVFEARVVESGRRVAVKKVYQDPGYKNRELPIMQSLGVHPNIVELIYAFKTRSPEADEYFLNLVLEFVPETMYRVVREYVKRRELPPLLMVKLYTYQMLRALAYIHAKGVCHRDIKPQNLLVDPRRGVLKLCDFGSAKQLIPGEGNVAYICSRYYRAPELIFGATSYTVAIDVWSAGCVFAEMLLGSPLFAGDSSVGQLVEIVRVLGTPTPEQIDSMNPSYPEFKLPAIDRRSWESVFRGKPTPPPEACDLLDRLLTYEPTRRITAIEALLHPFFDELRDPATRLPGGHGLPPLFDFSADELGPRAALLPALIPAWATSGADTAGASASSAASSTAASLAALPARSVHTSAAAASSSSSSSSSRASGAIAGSAVAAPSTSSSALSSSKPARGGSTR